MHYPYDKLEEERKKSAAKKSDGRSWRRRSRCPGPTRSATRRARASNRAREETPFDPQGQDPEKKARRRPEHASEGGVSAPAPVGGVLTARSPSSNSPSAATLSMSHHRHHSNPVPGSGAAAAAAMAQAGGVGMNGGGFVEVKSKFDAEFRRFSLDRSRYDTFEKFEKLLEDLHLGAASATNGVAEGVTPFVITYTDPKDGDQLPINNTDNYLRALQASRPLLRLVVQRQGEYDDAVSPSAALAYTSTLHSHHDRTGVQGGHNKSIFNSMLGTTPKQGGKAGISISRPSEFRQVTRDSGTLLSLSVREP